MAVAFFCKAGGSHSPVVLLDSQVQGKLNCDTDWPNLKLVAFCPSG